MKTTSAGIRRPLLACVALSAALSATGCTVVEGIQESQNGHQKYYSFTDGEEGKKEQVLPAWVPDGAKNVREAIRTTGSERIIAMDSSLKDIDTSSCTPIAPGQKVVPDTLKDEAWNVTYTPEDFLDRATLTADWWPAGQEHKTSVQCGKWWISEDGGKVYAFTPDLKSNPDAK